MSFIYLEGDVSGCEVRRTDAECGGVVGRARVHSGGLGSDFRDISSSSLQGDLLLALGHHHPLSAKTTPNSSIEIEVSISISREEVIGFTYEYVPGFTLMVMGSLL